MTTGIGDVLRDAREDQGRTAQAVAMSLNVRTDHVLALEREEWEVFGADAYARGHLRNYARELGLDPVPLMADYDLHVSTDDLTAHRIAGGPVATKPREPLPGWVKLVGVAALVLAALVVVGQVVGGRTPEPAPAVTDQPTAIATATPSPTPTATAAPTPVAPPVTGVNLQLVFERASWVRITVDGEVIEEGVVELGSTRDVVGDQDVLVRYGNAGGVEVTLNGQPLGVPGPVGQIAQVRYAPDGVVADDGGDA